MSRYLHLHARTRHSLVSLLIIMLLGTGIGCSSLSSDEESEGPNAPLQPITYESLAQSAPELETIDQGAYGGELVKGTRRVIRDQDAFATFWNSLHGETNTSVPDVDFSEQMVLAVVLGQRPTGGYAAEISSITWNTNPTVLRAFVTEIQPGPQCTVSQAVTVPYHIVKMETVDTDQIVFPDNGTQTQSCDS